MVGSEDTIKKILAALDGSDHAGKALELACDIAEKYGAELLLLHVIANWEVSRELRRFAAVEHIKESPQRLYRLVGEGLMHEAERHAQSKGLENVTPIVEEGDPATTIVAVAKARDVNLIVMGSRGVGGVKGLLMGSVSHKVAHLAPCTCVTVK